MTTIRGVLFDKDGTLFDFKATWSGWAAGMLRDVAGGDEARAAALGDLIGYDIVSGSFAPDSPVVACTTDEIVAVMAPALPEHSHEALVGRLNDAAALVRQVEAVPLAPVLSGLRARGLKLGVATNDSEAPARAHLAGTGQEGAFDFIAGYDSGYGGKPAPGMLLAFAAQMNLAPGSVVMVGDSRHDMDAGRAAGMRCVAVLTGTAGPADLSPFAEVVLPDIGHLPGWIDSQSL